MKGKKGDPQRIQVLVPICRPSLDPNVSGLRRCLSVGYSDEDLPLEEKILLDNWDINGSEGYVAKIKAIEVSRIKIY